MPDKPATRLHVNSDLAPRVTVALGAAEAHRLRSVLRLAPGDAIALFNGRDGEWLARIDALDRRGGAVTPAEVLRAQQDDGDLWLVFALIKRVRLEDLVTKATELGVSVLAPVTTERSVVERLNPERIAALAREAAEQSERLTLPEIRAPAPLARVIEAWPSGRRLLLCDETGRAPPIAQAFAVNQPEPLGVLIGPEGGFAETELDALRNLPFVAPVDLGPRVLRCETAALAAVAVVQALAGAWGATRRRRERDGAPVSP
jgi:16S rRNA (uracil1498-N3)-methyltransferase